MAIRMAIDQVISSLLSISNSRTVAIAMPIKKHAMALKTIIPIVLLKGWFSLLFAWVMNISVLFEFLLDRFDTWARSFLFLFIVAPNI